MSPALDHAAFLAETVAGDVEHPCSVCSTPTGRVDAVTGAPVCCLDHVAAARDSKPDAPGLVGLRVSVRLITDHGIRVIEFDDAQAIMAPGSDRGSLIITGRTEGMTDV